MNNKNKMIHFNPNQPSVGIAKIMMMIIAYGLRMLHHLLLLYRSIWLSRLRLRFDFYYVQTTVQYSKSMNENETEKKK